MRNVFWIILIIISLIGGWIFWTKTDFKDQIVSPKSSKKTENTEKVIKNTGFLAKYNFENLKKRENQASEIKVIGKALTVEQARKEAIKKKETTDKRANFETKAISFESNGKKISGMMNVPLTSKGNKLPAIIMIRGFAESEGYFIGSGSWKAADELARNGFVTVSLDFLGFGLSDDESKDILEARFEKPVSVLDLIESVKKMDIVDPNKIGIWAHSNGGQITISVLEITGQSYPTVLWAPMTNPFPASVLDSMDETTEAGQIVKTKIDEFEKEYDSKLYSIDNFYNWINAPILLHQGTADTSVKLEWQQTLETKLKGLGKNITLDIRQGNDHNFKQSWDEVTQMDIKFFKKNFGLN
jgi:dipeptidyl aminopeptidase/acylaminoacyl peptidase